jgi:hypothetical protein
LASRNLEESKEWNFQEIDGPEYSNRLVGYALSISKYNNSLSAIWIANRAPKMILKVFDILDQEISKEIDNSDFGLISGPILLSSSNIFFGCQKRLCTHKLNRENLLFSEVNVSSIGNTFRLKGENYLPISANRDLYIIPLSKIN